MKSSKAMKIGGIGAIGFFTLKGLVWLAIFAWGAWVAF